MLSAKTHSLLVDRIEFEAALNSFAYDNSVGLGELCSHVVNRWFQEKNIVTNLGCFKSLVWTLRQSLKPRVLKSNKILYLLPNQEERTLRQYAQLEDKADISTSQFLVINDFYRFSFLIIFVKWFINLPRFILRIKRVLNSDNANKALNGRALRTNSLIFPCSIQILRYKIAKYILKASHCKAVLVDLDRSSFGTPIILAARNLGISNATLVHGSVFPPYHYVPVLADKIFCWGGIHVDLFKKYTKKSVQYIVSGSLASAQNGELGDDKSDKLVSLVSQNFSDDLQYSIIKQLASISKNLSNKGIKLAVKGHPADDYKRLSKVCEDSRIYLFPKSTNLNQCINSTRVFIIVSSAFAFDALGYGIPIIFMPGKEEQSDLANLFHQEGNALVASNEQQLEDFLLDENLNKASYNLQDLKEFYTRYILRFGSEAAEVIVAEMNNS